MTVVNAVVDEVSNLYPMPLFTKNERKKAEILCKKKNGVLDRG